MSEKITVEIEVKDFEELRGLAEKLGCTPEELVTEAFRKVMADPMKYLDIKH